MTKMPMDVEFYLDEAQKFLIENKGEYEGIWYDEDTTPDFSDGEVFTGASKVVLVLPNDDYVIKVPYQGADLTSSSDCLHMVNEQCEAYKEYYEELQRVLKLRREMIHDAENREEADKVREVCPLPECPCQGCEREEVEEYKEEFYNAVPYIEDECERQDFIDEYGTNDYCAVETYLYERAVEYGVQDAFLEIKEIGMIGASRIYIQEKVDCDSSDKSSSSAEDRESYRSLAKSYRLSDVVGGLFLHDYGEEFVKKLVSFLEEYNISDLHNGNWTVVGGKPKLVDYGGYNEDC
jgi:hypothetical protein